MSNIKSMIRRKCGIVIQEQEQEQEQQTWTDPNPEGEYNETGSPKSDVMDFAMALVENFPDIPKIMDPCALEEYFESKCEEMGGQSEEEENKEGEFG